MGLRADDDGAARARWVRCAAMVLAGLIGAGAGHADEPPPPAAGVDYRAVYLQGPDRRKVEIRKHEASYLHRLPDAAVRAEIHYDPQTKVATIFEGDEVLRLRVAPGQIGGFDARAMMSGLSDTEVNWQAGETRRIAGAQCRVHLATGQAGGRAITGRFCVTPEGILLAIETGGPGRIGQALVAETLEIAPQPPEAFDMSPYAGIEITGVDAIR